MWFGLWKHSELDDLHAFTYCSFIIAFPIGAYLKEVQMIKMVLKLREAFQLLVFSIELSTLFVIVRKKRLGIFRP